MIRSSRERLRIWSLIDGSRSSIFAVTVDFTMLSGIRCGTTMISVSDRYSSRHWRADEHGDRQAPTTNGTNDQPLPRDDDPEDFVRCIFLSWQHDLSSQLRATKSSDRRGRRFAPVVGGHRLAAEHVSAKIIEVVELLGVNGRDLR